MIQLRQLQESDAPRLVELLDNINIWNNVRSLMPHPYLMKDAEEFISLHTKGTDSLVRAIDREGTLVGCAGLHRQGVDHEHTLELGYWIGEPYWRQGIATEAVSMICDLGFRQKGIERIYACVLEYNPGSMRILEKNGFVHEGTLRKHSCKKDGRWDEHRFGLLKSEYLAQKRNH